MLDHGIILDIYLQIGTWRGCDMWWKLILIFLQVDFAYILDVDSLGFNVKVLLIFNLCIEYPFCKFVIKYLSSMVKMGLSALYRVNFVQTKIKPINQVVFGYGETQSYLNWNKCRKQSKSLFSEVFFFNFFFFTLMLYEFVLPKPNTFLLPFWHDIVLITVLLFSRLVIRVIISSFEYLSLDVQGIESETSYNWTFPL